MARSAAAADHGSLRSLRVRNFRVFLSGQLVSQSGTWLQLVTVSWLVLQLTGSATALGWLAAATFGPLLVLGPWTGAVADRLDKRRLLLAVQALGATNAVVLGGLVLTGAITVELVYALTLVYGCLYAVEIPARRALVTELVEKPDIANAAALHSATTSLARVIGPLAAGGLMIWPGVGWCFVVNAASYAAGALGVSKMRPDELHTAARQARVRGQARAGLRYAWQDRELRATLLALAVVATLGFNHQVVIPLLAEQTFDGGAGTYALLFAAMSGGGLAGALMVARRRDVDRRFLGRTALAFGTFLALAALSPNVPVAVLFSALAGATGLSFVAGSTALLALRCAPAMRGRIMALSAMIVVGGAAIGGPIASWIAATADPRWAVAAGAVAGLCAGSVLSAQCRARLRATQRRWAPGGPGVEALAKLGDDNNRTVLGSVR